MSMRSLDPNEYIEPTIPGRRIKMKTRSALSLSDKIDIVEKVKFKFVPQDAVAKEYRVSPSTISALVVKIRNNPQFLRELANHKYERDKNKDQVATAVQEQLDEDLHISSVGFLQKHLSKEKGINVKEWVLRDVMRKELDLRYKRINHISWQGNSDKNLILRQQFAQHLLQIDFDK